MDESISGSDAIGELEAAARRAEAIGATLRGCMAELDALQFWSASAHVIQALHALERSTFDHLGFRLEITATLPLTLDD